MTSFKHLILPSPPDRQDLLIARLELLGIAGFVQNDDSVEFYVASRQWTGPFASTVRRISAETLKKRRSDLQVSSVKDQNWNAAWERSIKVVRATKRIIIRPSWKKVRGNTRGKIVITIDPKMSFGTGHHETTRICLRLMEWYLKRGMRVADFGTGTGILAIAAVKLGVRRVLAVDNDPWCVRNAQENLGLNSVRSGRIVVVLGSVAKLGSGTYDAIVANIDFPTIKKTIRRVISRTKKGGLIILSGLLVTDLVPLLELLLRMPVEPLRLESEGEWVGIALHKSERR